MIEPTDEMRMVAYDALPPEMRIDPAALDLVLANVLAVVARDRCMEAAGHVYHPLAAPVLRCRKCGSPLRDCAELNCVDPAQCGEVWCVEHMPDGEP